VSVLLSFGGTLSQERNGFINFNILAKVLLIVIYMA